MMNHSLGQPGALLSPLFRYIIHAFRFLSPRLGLMSYCQGQYQQLFVLQTWYDSVMPLVHRDGEGSGISVTQGWVAVPCCHAIMPSCRLHTGEVLTLGEVRKP